MNYPVIYVETEGQLSKLAEKLSHLSEFALDLEADVNLHRYGRKLCLAQFWDGDCCWLVDTTVLNISLLKQVMEDPKIVKVMYSASFDASLLADLADIELTGLMDLQVCGNLLGMGKRSLKHFIKELFDLDLEKDLQTSDWFRRPLTSEQIKYASLDVRYLLEAREILMPKLQAGDLLEQVWDACHKVEQSRFQEVENPHLRVRNSAHLTPYQRIFLKEFYEVRDKIACEWDAPSYRVFRSYQLIHLVKNPPHTMADFEQLNFFDEKLSDYKSDFLAATLKAQQKIMDKSSLVKKEVIELRHLLHKHPELSGKENSTNKRIQRFIRNFNPDKTIQGLGRTGLVFEFSGKEPGPAVLFRAAMDGVIGKETADIPWVSREKKVAHLFGNDGHVAILSGLAARLYETELKKGKVMLVFQSASENGKGALKMVTDKRSQQIQADYSFALQNLPGFPENSIIISDNGFCSASTGLLIKLRKENPQQESGNSLDFSHACGEIISNIPLICTDDDTQSKASIIYIQMGKQNFVNPPDQAEIRIRLRSMNDESLEEIKSSALEYIHKISLEHNLEFFHSFIESFPGMESSKDAIDIIKSVCSSQDSELITRQTAFHWSDDFGHFAQISAIAMFGIGAGVDHPQRGSMHYDFPDALIEPAIDFLLGIVSELELF
ncbi:MAG: M20/M25/M40 family metallo-hydrolase [Candidatus Cloacimonetes bacterium]|nr:M20/M25/M40 family metallo-hydrolase [Candidatus Cloacimonadota bacterium]